MKKLIGFHTFCTKRNNKVELPDYEVLTWLASILSWKRHNGELWIHTDNIGLAWMQKVGIDKLYDKVLLTLEHMPPYLKHQIFWAGAKLYALQETPTPCVSFDLDTIFWNKFPEYSEELVTLHEDGLDWPCYIGNKEKFEKYGYNESYWDWDQIPLNVGFLYIKDEQLKKLYTERAINFMRRFSLENIDKAKNNDESLAPMVFCEQQSLAMCAKLLNKRVKPAFKLSYNFHLQNNKLVSHIWNSKETYRKCIKARRVFTDYLKSWIKYNFPKYAYLINNVNDKQNNKAFYSSASVTDSLNGHCQIIEKAKPNCWIRDANVPAYRTVKDGDVLFYGETFFP